MSLEDNNPLPPQPLPANGDVPAEESLSSVNKSILTQDLRVPWDWFDLLIFAILAWAGSSLLSFSMGRMFLAFGGKLADLRASPSEMGLFTIAHQALLFVALLSYLFAQIRLNFGVPFWRTIGWRAFQPSQVPRAIRYLGFLAGGFFLAVAAQIVSIAFGNKAKVPMQALFQDRRTALLLLLMAVFVAPVVEETIFRGFIYPVVARSFGVAGGVFATGVVFGLLHAPQLWGGWAQIVSLVIVGVVFTYARAVAQTVLASYLLHVSYNFSISFAFLLGSHWLRLISPSH